MREVLFAFVMPRFCPLVADDTGLIFKEKRSGEWLPSAMLRYSGINLAEFHGSNVNIVMKSGEEYKASVLQKPRLTEIFKEKKVKATPHKDRASRFAARLLASFPSSCTKSP